MIDVKSLSDEQLTSMLSQVQGGSQAQEPQSVDPSQLTDEQLTAAVSGLKQNVPLLYLDEKMSSDSESKITFMDRLKMAFGNETGKEDYLKNVKQFKFVEKTPDGKFFVGDDLREMSPVDPEGMSNDFLKDMVDLAGIATTIAGQIAGASVGTLAQPGLGTVAGGAVGAGIGQGLSQQIGKMAGTYKADPMDEAVDVVTASAFGAAGETLGLGIKAAGGFLSPKIGKIFDNVIKNSSKLDPLTGQPTEGIFLKTLAKGLKITSGVKEESTFDAALSPGGFEKTFSGKFLDKREVINIANKMSNAIDSAEKTLSSEVASKTENLVKILKRSKQSTGVDVRPIYSNLLDDLKSRGMMNQFGEWNRLAPASADLNLMKKLVSTLKPYVGSNKGNLPVDKAISLAREFGQKFDNLTPVGESNIYKVLNGEPGSKIPGIRQAVRNMAQKVGYNDYAVALDKFSKFQTMKNEAGIIKGMKFSDLESFIKNIENKGLFTRGNLKMIDNAVPQNLKFYDDMIQWNAAQDFSSSNPSLLRMNAIAGLAGAGFGGGDIQERIRKGAAAFVITTPAGIRTVLRGTQKFGGASSGAIKGLAGKVPSAIRQRGGSAVLSQILKSTSSQREKR